MLLYSLLWLFCLLNCYVEIKKFQNEKSLIFFGQMIERIRMLNSWTDRD